MDGNLKAEVWKLISSSTVSVANIFTASITDDRYGRIISTSDRGQKALIQSISSSYAVHHLQFVLISKSFIGTAIDVAQRSILDLPVSTYTAEHLVILHLLLSSIGNIPFPSRGSHIESN